MCNGLLFQSCALLALITLTFAMRRRRIEIGLDAAGNECALDETIYLPDDPFYRSMEFIFRHVHKNRQRALRNKLTTNPSFKVPV